MLRSGRQALAFLVVLLAVQTTAASTRADDLANAVKPLVDAHQGDVTVVIKNLGTGDEYEWHADKVMPTASLIKFPLMIAAYQAIHDGKLTADQLITIEQEDMVPGSGILTTHFSAGAKISLRDAIHLMIVYSDNTATNLVINEVGLEAVAKLMDELDCPETKFNSKVFRRDTSIFPERSQQYGLGSTTAADMVKLLELLHKGELVDKDSCERMLEHLYACDDKAKFPRYLREVKIAHKTGSVNATRCDAGLIDCPGGPIALCVLTNQNADQSWGDENEAEILCARIARAAYRHFNDAEESLDPAGTGTLTMGDSGPLVAALQRTLNARLTPSPELSVDGDFGGGTQSAVIAFQKQSGIVADGEVRKEMWEALGELVTDDPEAPDPATINGAKLTRKKADPLDGQPYVTAKAWAIADGETGELLWSSEADKPLDIASTTKIMTAYVVMKYCEEHPEALDEILTFSRRADETIGSTAELNAGEKVSVRELLYGMMLPSGNDATVAFGEFFGGRVAPGGGESDEKLSARQAYDKFIEAMNAAAAELGMENSHFENTHGLTEPGHQASAADLARLAIACRKMPLFCEVTGTRQRGATVEGPGGYRRNVMWKNTNKLLEIDGYDGVKTGTTNAAGACLVSHAVRGDRQLMLVVLGATSSDARYMDSRNLYRWAWNQLGVDE
jgi:serine-type D-Ala-D-Ala carboxypeptidase (penicillin-binding protein 5/6)